MDKITEQQKDKAIEQYAVTGNMTQAAEFIGMNRKTLQREMGRSKAFNDDMKAAKEKYADKEEERILIKHKDDKNVVWDIFRLKSLKPDIYREQIAHKIEGNIKVVSGIPRPDKKGE